MSTLKKTAIWITLLAVFLKLSGFIRESIISNKFGVSDQTDGYVYAFTLVTLVVAMISGGFNSVFLPMYTQKKLENEKEADKNATGIMNGIVLVFLLVSVAGYILIPYILPLITPSNLAAGAQDVAIRMMRIFFLGMSAIALNGIMETYLQTRKIFVPAQISKILATLMGAVFAIFFSGRWGIYSLAYGFIFGTFLGILIQSFFLWKGGFKWYPSIKVEKDFNKAFLILLLPAVLNSVVSQFNVFVNKTFALGTTGGGATYLDKASLLVSIPNTIYLTTIVAIIFTLLSEQVGDKKKFQNTVFMGLQVSFVTLFPIAIGLFLLGKEAIAFVYQRGLFTAEDTANTYIAMVLYLPMIIAQALQYIVSKAMFAMGKTKVIFKISVTTIAINFIVNMLIVDTLGYPGLAVTASVVNIYLLVVSTSIMYREFEPGESRRLFVLIARVIPPTLFMAVPIYIIKHYTQLGALPALVQLGLFGTMGVVLYAIGLFLFYREAFDKLLSLVKRKSKKTA